MSKLLVISLVLAACTGDVPAADPDPGAADPGEQSLPDGFGADTLPPDDAYVPEPVTATRFGVFYQVSADVLAQYQDESGGGLPHVANHAWIITHSNASVLASRALADLVHQRDDFYYFPAFDVWKPSHAGWTTADDATLQQIAYEFRDYAIAHHADGFAFNEVPSTAGGDDALRARIAKLLRWLHEPDARGRVLPGVVYFTEKQSLVASWDGPASDFFAAIDETSVALVVEHYHSTGYMCSLSESALASHYFGLRDWLDASGEPAKVSIANSKFTVLHSARFSVGASGWAGGDATTTTLADYQRALSRVAKVTRQTEGGLNRLSFAPVTTAITEAGVQPRITELYRWHYLHTAPEASELPCIAGDAGNCSCD